MHLPSLAVSSDSGLLDGEEVAGGCQCETRAVSLPVLGTVCSSETQHGEEFLDEGTKGVRTHDRNEDENEFSLFSAAGKNTSVHDKRESRGAIQLRHRANEAYTATHDYRTERVGAITDCRYCATDVWKGK